MSSKNHDMRATYYGRGPRATVHTHNDTSAWVEAGTFAIALGAFVWEAFTGFFPAAYESLSARARKLFR